MNKAFTREPDADGRVHCPRCGSLGVPVSKATLDRHVQEASRQALGDSAWFCDFARCEIGYFDQFDRTAAVDELQSSVYPKDPTVPICACFGFTFLHWQKLKLTWNRGRQYESANCWRNRSPATLNVRRSRLTVDAVCVRSSDFT
jgi:hypothetical protein